MIIVVAVIVAGVVLLAVLTMFMYNKLVAQREQVRSAFAHIDVQLERRHDLIPSLVEVAKGYLGHERDVLVGVVDARAAATQALIEVNSDSGNLDAMQRLGASEGALTSSLGRLLAVAEEYPDLKASQMMTDLSAELVVTEDRIAYSRQHYNDRVADYQTYKASFPPVVFASAFRFHDRPYLHLDDVLHKRGNIQVSLDE